MSVPWYMGVGTAEFTERSSFTPVSYGNRVWLLGGTSKATPQLDEIWVSGFSGVVNYAKSPCKRG